MNSEWRPVGSSGGRVLHITSDKAVSEGIFTAPVPQTWDRWVAAYRTGSCWMYAATGTILADIPAETQMILFECGLLYEILLPLVRDGFRASLEPGAEENLCVRVESGSSEITATSFDAMYRNRSDDPYALMRTAAADLREELNTFTLPSETPVPEFCRWYGWCSWNAFYADVSEAKVERVLESFAAHGIVPGFIIIDAGWQECSGKYLKGYASDSEKFPDGMVHAVSRFRKHGVRRTLLWQTYNGYWNGIEPGHGIEVARHDMVPALRFVDEAPQSPNLHDQIDTTQKAFYPRNVVGRPVWHPASYERFYDAYYDHHRQAGVTGVKIDAITWIETCGEKMGGRVAAMERFVRAAERAIDLHLDGDAIWCSSCSNDFIFLSRGGGVVRTSTDFFPDKPETHGKHIYANAINSFFMGEFVRPDWDMFQSGLGEASEFHAAARSISGGPVYSTDAFGKENFDLIRRLVLPDGTVPLCTTHARPTRESLFADPDGDVVTVFNNNATTIVVGVFNTCYGPESPSQMHAIVRPGEIPGARRDADYAVFRWADQTVQRFTPADSFEATLPPLGFELLTCAEIRHGFAPLGDPTIYNTGGVIGSWESCGNGLTIAVRSCRSLIAYCEQSPRTVTANGTPLSHRHCDDVLVVEMDSTTETTITISW